MENPEQKKAEEANIKYHYTPEQLMRMGRKELVIKMIGAIGIEFSGNGIDAYLSRELAEIIEDEKNDI